MHINIFQVLVSYFFIFTTVDIYFAPSGHIIHQVQSEVEKKNIQIERFSNPDIESGIEDTTKIFWVVHNF